MKSFTRLFALAVFFFCTSNVLAQLSGTYTVPGDYATIQAAADDLETQGVSGAVIISIATNTYNETVDVDPIGSASAVNTITFQSASGTRTCFIHL